MKQSIVKRLHGLVWRRLPKVLRRASVEKIAALLAPTPSRQPSAGRSVTVVGVLSAPSGLGQSARLCEQAFSALGETVERADVSDIFLARSPNGGSDADLRESSCGPGVIIAHINSPLLPLGLLSIGRRRLEDRVVVGYWAWELPIVPDSWRRGLDFVHEIWVPSRFVQHAVGFVAAGIPVRIVPHPVAIDRLRCFASSRIASEHPFTALIMFDIASGFSRKNPLAAIKAFRLAFGNDPKVRLVVKFQHADAYPRARSALLAAAAGNSNIELDGSTTSRAAISRLIAQADVFLSLHRAEGFGLGIAEAMAAGVPVICTDWSGSTDFVDAECGMPISYRMIPAIDPQGEYNHEDMCWADPDPEHAASALRHLRNNPAECLRLGQAGRARVVEKLGTEGYATALAACRSRFP